MSSMSHLSTGVPQGSVLGPLLFSLYINDLPQILQPSNILMYADDTCVIVTGKNLTDLESKSNMKLEKVAHWLSNNKLSINTDKTKCITFRSRLRFINANDIHIKIDDSVIEQVTTIKYLGVTIDNNLHWQMQIQNVCSKLASGCHALTQARQYFNTTTLRMLYCAFIHCHISYCIESWGGTYTTYLDPVRRLQKRAVRIITHSKYNDPSKPLFSRLLILPFDKLWKLKLARCVHTVINYNHPFHVSMFSAPSRSTRQLTFGKWNIPRTNNVYGERLLQFVGIKIWNVIPFEIKMCSNFTKALEKHYLEECTDLLMSCHN